MKLLFSLTMSLFVTVASAFPYKPLDYQLNMKFDFATQKLFGNCEISLQKMKNDKDLSILLYRLMVVKYVKDKEGHQLPFTQKVVAFNDQENFQTNFIQIMLNGKIKIGDTCTVIISYEGYLAGYVETGMLYVKDEISPSFTIIRPDALAYPILGSLSREKNRAEGLSYFSYTVSTTVPDSLYVANGGRLVTEAKSENNQVTYVYKNIKPAWRIDIVVGKYGLLKNDWLKVYYFREDSVGARSIADAALKSYALFTSWFGEIDNQEYSIVEIPENCGSQADVTCIIQTADAFRNNESMFELYHELSHLWNLVPSDSFPSRLESEGLAMFLQYLIVEKINGETGLLDKKAEKIFQWIKRKFNEAPQVAKAPIIDYGKSRLTDYVYSTGMIFFYLLYKECGEKVFMTTIKKFYTTYRNKMASINDLMAIISNTCQNKKSSQIIKDWIYTSLHSELISSSKTINEIIAHYENGE